MSALTTHTFDNQREKEKEKKQIKETPTSDRKPKKDKEQDQLKKTCLRPLRQGQRLDTSETKPCSRKKHKPPKHEALLWGSVHPAFDLVEGLREVPDG
jgi:hypothetical protein